MKLNRKLELKEAFVSLFDNLDFGWVSVVKCLYSPTLKEDKLPV